MRAIGGRYRSGPITNRIIFVSSVGFNKHDGEQGRFEDRRMTRSVEHVGTGLIGGIAHVIAVFVLVWVYVTESGHDFSTWAFVDGGVPIVVLAALGAVCSLFYLNYRVISPTVLILSIDAFAVLSSPPEVWTVPTPAGPPSIYGFYIHLFFVAPLGLAVLAGAVEHYIRGLMRTETTRPSS